MRKTRIFYSDNGTLTDWTIDLGNYKSGNSTFSFDPAQDYIYIGNVAPFNHFYIKMGSTVNASTATMSLAYWGGTSWENVVEIIDETDGLAQSGFVTWVPDRNKSWTRSNTNDGGQVISGLTSVNIYDLHWLRIGFSGTVDPALILSWVGQKFSDDNDLGAEYPELTRSSVKTAFESGKTTYEEQSVRASEIIVGELTKNNIIWTANQILDREDFKLPCVSKTAEIVFNAFGDDYADQKQRARQEFDSRMKKSVYAVDLNNDGRLSIGEQKSIQGFFSR